MTKVLCDRHGVAVNGPGGLTLRLRTGPCLMAAVGSTSAPRAAAEFVSWLGDRDVAVAGDAREAEP